ncbi:MAG: HD domain-containing protein [Melioribacteraceae bacterium]|nr:HD domain-containing protein [Melioribacteraceae bacterium]
MSDEKKNLSKMNEGDPISGSLVVERMDLKISSTNKFFIDIDLRGATAKLNGKVWDNAQVIYNKIKDSKVVTVKGVLTKYKDQFQIKIEKIESYSGDEVIFIEQTMPRSTNDFDEMKNEFLGFINSIQDPHLNKLLNEIFSSDDGVKFFKSPAGKSWHHAYLSGLLEHTLEIIKICDLMASFHKEVKRDILLSGAMLHDFGKIIELSSEPGFEYTDTGKFVGHIVLAVLFVDRTIKEKFTDFPSPLKDQLFHVILSHQGKLEYASPVEPKTIEAIILYQADELSAKTNAYKQAITKGRNEGSKWTRPLPLANNNSLFIPEDFEIQ